MRLGQAEILWGRGDEQGCQHGGPSVTRTLTMVLWFHNHLRKSGAGAVDTETSYAVPLRTCQYKGFHSSPSEYEMQIVSSLLQKGVNSPHTLGLPIERF